MIRLYSVFVLIAAAVRITSCLMASMEDFNNYNANEKWNTTYKYNVQMSTAETEKYWPSASQQQAETIERATCMQSNNGPFPISRLNTVTANDQQANVLRLMSMVCLMAVVMVLAVFTGFYALLYWRDDDNVIRSLRSADPEKQDFRHDNDDDDDDDDDDTVSISTASSSQWTPGPKDDDSSTGDDVMARDRPATMTLLCHHKPKRKRTKDDDDDSWYSHKGTGAHR